MPTVRTRRWRARECHCSFCGKSAKQVAKLIAGPGVWICDECVGRCGEIISRERAGKR